MSDVPEISNRKRLSAVGLLSVAVFLAFNAAYWPVHSCQVRNAPENFLMHARYLDAQGDRKEALNRLEEGIRQFHPACPEPYQTLLQWRSQDSARDQKHLAWLEAAGTFYEALNGPGETRGTLLVQAADLQCKSFKLPPIASDSVRQIASLMKNLGRLWGVEKPLAELTVKQHVALLSLGAGDTFDLNGIIGNTGVKSPVDILVQSGGGRMGRECTHILVRNHDYAGGKRGFHGVLLDPKTGQMIQMGLFDVWQSEDEAERMVRFLEEAPEGAIGAFAVADEASVNLTAELVRELHGFGLAERTFIHRQPALFGLHFSFAAIGVKGASPGTALQAWSPGVFDGCPGHPVTCGVLRPVEGTP